MRPIQTFTPLVFWLSTHDPRPPRTSRQLALSRVGTQALSSSHVSPCTPCRTFRAKPWQGSLEYRTSFFSIYKQQKKTKGPPKKNKSPKDPLQDPSATMNSLPHEGMHVETMELAQEAAASIKRIAESMQDIASEYEPARQKRRIEITTIMPDTQFTMQDQQYDDIASLLGHARKMQELIARIEYRVMACTKAVRRSADGHAIELVTKHTSH